MKKLQPFIFILPFLFFFSKQAVAKEEVLTIFQDRKISISVPNGFNYSHNRDAQGLDTVDIADQGGKIKLLVTFVPDSKGQMIAEGFQRENLSRMCAQYIDESVEKKMIFKVLKPKTGTGTYCIFTDSRLVGKSEKPKGQYLLSTTGIKAWPGCFLFFTLFSDNTTSVEYAEAMKLLVDGFSEMPGKADNASDSTNASGMQNAVHQKISIPGKGWWVEFECPPLEDREESKKGDDYAFRARNGRFNLSMFVETPSAKGGHKECQEYYWEQAKKNPVIKQDTVKISHFPNFSRVEYIIETPFGNETFRMKNVNYYFAYQGKWMDLHISLGQYQPSDEEVFKKFDSSLKYTM